MLLADFISKNGFLQILLFEFTIVASVGYMRAFQGTIEKSNLSDQGWSHKGSTLKKKVTRNSQNSRPAETGPYTEFTLKTVHWGRGLPEGARDHMAGVDCCPQTCIAVEIAAAVVRCELLHQPVKFLNKDFI